MHKITYEILKLEYSHKGHRGHQDFRMVSIHDLNKKTAILLQPQLVVKYSKRILKRTF